MLALVSLIVPPDAHTVDDLMFLWGPAIIIQSDISNWSTGFRLGVGFRLYLLCKKSLVGKVEVTR